MKRLGLLLTAALLALASCSSSNPLDGKASSGSNPASITVGSASFPESEIIAELYAQALEAKGFTVTRRMQIGQRDAYVAAVKDGSIDLVPEYTGNLLQYFDQQTAAKTPDEVTAALAKATPDGLAVLTPAPAEDKDSYNVTRAFATQYNLASLGDLKNVPGTLKVGGNPELAERPYGPKGLVSVYGVPADKIVFTPISDSGGPLTVKALKDGDVHLADIYSTTPAIAENDFVTLADPNNLILSQHVVPLISTRITDSTVATTLNAVSAKLTTGDLLALNQQNQGPSKASPRDVASAWLRSKGLS